MSSQRLRELMVMMLAVLLATANLNGHDLDDPQPLPPGIGAGMPFDSNNMELLSHMTLADIGGGPANVWGNDCWGWTDPQDGTEYAIFGLSNATSFIDISTPTDPKFLGTLLTHTGNVLWRDIKVFGNHAYIVADFNSDHGMQIFDLTELRTADRNNPTTFTETGYYGGVGNVHNIVINEQTGFAYLVGANNQANGGLHVLDLNANPIAPVVAGNFGDDGYTHDAQVVVYNGPDSDYSGDEIAFCCNEDTLTIVNVSDKSNMQMVSRTGYSEAGYVHQGWLSEDQRFFFQNDERDELNLVGAGMQNVTTRTHIWDLADLDNPLYQGFYESGESSVDHNNYVKGDRIYQANYQSGLRVLDIGDPTNPSLSEYAFFDTFSAATEIGFNGAWSCYPFFDSDAIIVSDVNGGLFVVKLLDELLLGDINCDGAVNLLDVAPFIALLDTGTFIDKADLNEDGAVNLLDVAPFVDLLSGK